MKLASSLFLVLLLSKVLLGQVPDSNELSFFSQKLLILFSENSASIENPQIIIGGAELSAGRASYDRIAKKVSLEGTVTYNAGKVFIRAESASIDVQNLELIFTNASLFDPENQLYATAAKAIRESGTVYRLEDLYLTQCLPGEEAWFFKIREAKFVIGNYSSGKDLEFRVYDVPIIYLPIFAYPTVVKRQSGYLLPGLKISSVSGAEGYGFRFSVPYFYSLGVDHDITFTPELLTGRGLAAGLEYNYAFKTGMRGRASYWMIDEFLRSRSPDTENLMTASDDKKPFRSVFDFQHKSYITDSSTELFADIKLRSDNEVRSDYLGEDYTLDTKKLLRVETNFDWNNYRLTLFAEDKEDFLYESRYNLTTDPYTLNEVVGVYNYYKTHNLLFLPLQFDVKHRAIEFKRDLGWNGTYNHITPSILYNYSSNYLHLFVQSQADAYSYASNYKLGSSKSTQDFDYYYLTHRIGLDVNFLKVPTQNSFLSSEVELNPYIIGTYRDDVDSRGSLSKSPADSFMGDQSDYDKFIDMFKTGIKHPARKSIELGANYRFIRSGISNKTLAEGNVSTSYDSFRAAEYVNNPSRFKGPIISEKYSETKTDQMFLPVKAQVNFYPSNLVTISANTRFNQYSSHFVEKSFSFSTGTTEIDLTRVSYHDNDFDYKDLDGYPHFAAETLSVYRDYLINEKYLLSVSAAWSFHRRNALNLVDTERLSQTLTNSTINLRYIHCCYSVDFGLKNSINERTVLGDITQEYRSSVYYIRLNLLGNSFGQEY